jgi:hypothetical protein
MYGRGKAKLVIASYHIRTNPQDTPSLKRPFPLPINYNFSPINYNFSLANLNFSLANLNFFQGNSLFFQGNSLFFQGNSFFFARKLGSRADKL